ncbi:MAG: hypothetical protein A2Y94_05815 [Caldithrix sp. RBG_13_44_9]|nr:MAG: hypothetical protein A2Y94_05815 [Caldithrix sp. RBG_13_44_9]
MQNPGKMAGSIFFQHFFVLLRKPPKFFRSTLLFLYCKDPNIFLSLASLFIMKEKGEEDDRDT